MYIAVCILQREIKICLLFMLQTEKSFLNIDESNQIWVVITLFRLIRHQMKFRFVPNQSEKCNYNPFDLARFRKDFSMCTCRY